MEYAQPRICLEKHTHKLLWDFDIQTDHLFSARRPDLIMINKRKENLQNCRLCCPGWLHIEKQNEKTQIPQLCYGIEQTMENESDNDTNLQLVLLIQSP